MLETLVRAALANAHIDSVVVRSAGTGASNGDHASIGAQRAMQRRGLNLSHHVSRNVRSLDLTTFDHFWCMTPSHAASLLALGVPATAINVVNAAGGGVPDPWGGDDDDYEGCAIVLELAARDLAELFSTQG